MSINNELAYMAEKLKFLKNKRVRYIGRAGNLLWIGIGEDVSNIDYKGRKRVFAKFSLHIQCPFRILLNTKIIIGNNDIYEPNTEKIPLENFNWESYGDSLFDKQLEKIASELYTNDVKVIDINLSLIGDLQIILSNNLCIETFINGTSNSEMWRFFETGTDLPHFVKTGINIEKE